MFNWIYEIYWANVETSHHIFKERLPEIYKVGGTKTFTENEVNSFVNSYLLTQFCWDEKFSSEMMAKSVEVNLKIFLFLNWLGIYDFNP